jgi:hypothetical protein
MTRFGIYGALAVLSALVATPALAQRMIDEPGMYAFYHPNADPNTASAPADAMARDLSGGNHAVTMKMKMRNRYVQPRR